MSPARASSVTPDVLLQQVAAEHAPALDDLTAEILARLRATVPEFFADDDVAWDMARAVAANVRRFAELLDGATDRARTMTPPHEAGDLLDSTIQHGIPLVSLLEAYRAAQGLAAAWWQERIERSAPPHLAARAIRRLSDVLVAYIDAAAAAIRSSYDIERRALESSADGRRTHLVRRLLAGEPLDAEAAARTLNHPLAGRHVALVLWREDDDVPDDAVGATLTDAAAALGGPRVLTLAARHRVYAWLSSSAELDPGPLQELRTPRGVRAAMSGVHRGVDGFVLAHEDAVRAAGAVRGARDTGDRRIATFERVELVTLLAREPEATRRFVQRVLGPLAEDSPHTAGHRETLRVFLAAGSSPTRAAEHLGVHRNTVMYRLRMLEAIVPGLGAPGGDWAASAERRLEVELALRLVDHPG